MYDGVGGVGTDDASEIHMIERPPTDADGRMDPMVPELPTRRVQPDGGRARETTAGIEEVLAEADAPLVPDLS
jgi:hypothetical protein